jgi:hypothetical protein
MRELEGRSYADIAELLGISVAAVETLLFRARRALREQLEGSLSCSEAEAALSLQLDGRLSRADAGPLRSHLRSCETCRRLARRQRAQRKGFKALAVVPLPSGLASLFGGGASGIGVAGLGAAVATKVVAVTVAAVVVGGGGYAIVKHETASTHPAAARAAHTGSPASAKAAGKHATRTGTSSRPGSRGRSAGHAVRSSAAGAVSATGSTHAHVHPLHQAAAPAGVARQKSQASAHRKSTSHTATTPAGKPGKRSAPRPRTHVLPLVSRACRAETAPSSTEAVTTTSTTATTTAAPASCANAHAHAKGNAGRP